MAKAEATKDQTHWLIREEDILWRLEGGVRGRELLVGIMASTENMTVGKINFLGGQRSSESRAVFSVAPDYLPGCEQ